MNDNMNDNGVYGDKVAIVSTMIGGTLRWYGCGCVAPPKLSTSVFVCKIRPMTTCSNKRHISFKARTFAFAENIRDET